MRTAMSDVQNQCLTIAYIKPDGTPKESLAYDVRAGVHSICKETMLSSAPVSRDKAATLADTER